jgi:hypothetical protein
LSGRAAGDTLDLSTREAKTFPGAKYMIERQTELKRRHHRKEKMRKLKAKLQGATGADRDKLMYKIHRLSPLWTEASLTQSQATAAPTSEESKAAPKKKAPPKKKPQE